MRMKIMAFSLEDEMNEMSNPKPLRVLYRIVYRLK